MHQRAEDLEVRELARMEQLRVSKNLRQLANCPPSNLPFPLWPRCCNLVTQYRHHRRGWANEGNTQRFQLVWQLGILRGMSPTWPHGIHTCAGSQQSHHPEDGDRRETETERV